MADAEMNDARADEALVSAVIEGPYSLRQTVTHAPSQVNSPSTDGSHVRTLPTLRGVSFTNFELSPRTTSVVVAHRSVEEIWYFLSGLGKMWGKLSEHEEVVSVDAGVCITIPRGTHFPFRSYGYEPLAAIGITMPLWPGEGEAYEVQGRWPSTVRSGNSIPD